MDPSQGGSGASNSSDFVRKLYKMLENQTDTNVVRWGNEGDSFVVLENEKFTKHILPKHFKHSNFASFVRQLNKYDFHKVRHNNEESGQSPYGPGAWEFKHPDFKVNNKDALDSIKRKAPAPRKQAAATEDVSVPTQQMDLVNSQLVATQQQLQQLQERYNELSVHHSMLLQEVMGIQKTVVNHEHVMQNVMSFLHSVDAQRRRDSRIGFPPNTSTPNGSSTAQGADAASDDDGPASPLQHATKLLSETNADTMLNPRNLEQMNEITMRLNGTLTTPPPEYNNHNRPGSRAGPGSTTSTATVRVQSDLDGLVYPFGQNHGIDPADSEHINNIPYPMPTKTTEAATAGQTTTASATPGRKKAQFDPGWIRPPQILLVEDDPTCRRIGGKFLYAFHCSIDNALDGLEAVNKMNAGSKYDLVLMDIIMPNLDGVSACHLIRQFDSTPIIAMTSNIRSDDISMYFQHGMNDVLPKPFTKEGLLSMLEKHLAHLKKPVHQLDGMGPPQPQPLSARHSIKDEGSPAKSPATSSWNSPTALTGVSPVASSIGDDYSMSGVGPGHHPSYSSGSNGIPPGYNAPPPSTLRAGQGHRRQLSDISGGEEMPNNPKRQQMYGGMQYQPPPINSMHQRR